jgi:hypothetical protein
MALISDLTENGDIALVPIGGLGLALGFEAGAVNAAKFRTLAVPGANVGVFFADKGDEFKDVIDATLESGVDGLPAMWATEERRFALGSRRRNQRYRMNAVTDRLTRAIEMVMPVIVCFERPLLGGGGGGGSAVGVAVTAVDVAPETTDAKGTSMECDIRAVARVGFPAATSAVTVSLSEACQLICTSGAQNSSLPFIFSSSSLTSPFSPHVPAWSRLRCVDVTARWQVCHPRPGYVAHVYPIGQQPTAVSPSMRGNWKLPSFIGPLVIISCTSFCEGNVDMAVHAL